ncbi:MAG: SUMF1/EgtB/PvdO family nonheme iron enzyme [Chitinispirillaceae bacterium]|nr:SUMF1/EgtB/PvdO family nonheme iron enzyme [Chitinispirillaceae bacterium]
MHRVIIMAALLFCISAAEAADVNLTGTVKKENGDGISGARVSLKRHHLLVAITDANGAFTLSGNDSITTSSDSLVVITRGYRTMLEAISSYEKSDIALTQTPSNTWVPYQSEPLEHSGGMVKIKAKGHDFEMGQPCDTVRLKRGKPNTDIEQPVHTVYFTYDFWMDTVEVRQAEYDSLMQIAYGTSYVRPTFWSPSNGLGKNWPAYSMEWGSAALFCNARSKCQGLPDTAYSYSGIVGSIGDLCTLQNVSVNLHAEAYRLPTEAEWEYACRGGTVTDFYWGKDYDHYRTATSKADIDSFAIWTGNSFDLGKDSIFYPGPGLDSSYYGAHETGKRIPNDYGLYDMAGNLSEWCNDLLNYYAWGAATDPTGIVPEDVTGFSRVLRGGNWSNSETYLRSTERQFAAVDYPFLFCGFRAVSSGITTGIKKTEKCPRQRLPSINVSSGRIRCSNAAGCDIGIYSLNGRMMFSARLAGRLFSYETASLPAGSYIVRIKSTNETSRVITVLPR